MAMSWYQLSGDINDVDADDSSGDVGNAGDEAGDDADVEADGNITISTLRWSSWYLPL